MHKFILVVVLALPAAAQTQPPASELLQRGIYAQETAGDLDGAIKIFRQIVDSHPQQRELGAQAQYRLGMTLLAKGDTNGASQEIQRLGWDYPDYNALIASANKASGRLRVPPTSDELQAIAEERDRALFNAARPGFTSLVYQGQTKTSYSFPPDQVAGHETMFNFGRSLEFSGTVVQIQWSNPYTTLRINTMTTEPPITVMIASANTLERAGWNHDTVKLGDQVTITGAPAPADPSVVQATQVVFRGQPIFSRPNLALPQRAISAYEK